MDKELYINGELVDLGDDTVIAITKQVNEIGDISSLLGDLTNEFTLPYTQTNNLIFGLSNKLQSGSTIPYTRLEAKFVDRGVEVISNGAAILRSADDGYKVVIYHNNSGSLQDLEGKRLRDLTFTEFNHIWNTAAIHASRVNTEGYIYPIIDYGRMSNSGVSIETKELFPAFFVHTIITKIFEDIGWTVEGNILTDTRYLNFLIAWSMDDFIHSDEQLELFKLDAVFPTSQVFNYLASSGNQIYDVDLDDSTNVVNGKYVVPATGLQSFEFIMEGTYTTSAGTGGGQMQHQIYNYTTSTVILNAETVSTFTPSSSGGIDGTLGGAIWSVDDVEVTVGDEIGLRITMADVALDVTITVKKNTSVDLTGNFSFFRNVLLTNKILTNNPFKLSDQLPDMTQVDFLKSVFAMMGIIPQSQSYNQTVILKGLDDLLTNDSTDMSERYSESQDDPIEFSESSFAQNNLFRYIQDDGVSLELGNYSIPSNNTSLPIENVYVDLPFGSSNDVLRLVFGANKLSVPLIKKVYYAVNDGIQVNTVEQMLFYPTTTRVVVLDRQDLSFNLHYNGNGFGDADIDEDENIPLCYFSKSGEVNNLDWETLTGDYYNVLTQMLINYKRIIANFTLKSPDIENFDHFKSWYLSKYSAKFFPMRISNYKNGQKTSVELVKI